MQATSVMQFGRRIVRSACYHRAAVLGASLFSAFASGCSTHPVQQQATGLPTTQLVEFIRCETRLAVQDKALLLLSQEDNPNPILDQFALRRGEHWDLDIKVRLTPLERQFYNRYVKTGIAYDFSFDISEENGASAGANLSNFSPAA